MIQKVSIAEKLALIRDLWRRATRRGTITRRKTSSSSCSRAVPAAREVATGAGAVNGRAKGDVPEPLPCKPREGLRLWCHATGDSRSTPSGALRSRFLRG
jgi:hypothetical protein